MSKHQSKTAYSSSLVAVTLFFSAAYVASAAQDTWSSSPSSANWNTANWTGGNSPPLAGDALEFGSSSITALNNNFTAGTAFDGIYFQSGNSFTLNGSGVLLSGAVSNTVGVQNASGAAQTFGNLPLTLDWGYYTFSSFGTLALNGGLTANPGGVAYFDANNTSTSLTLDATTGLISGLEGTGLMYDGNFTPTALATISGGNIVAYTATTPLATPGALANGNNIELTANGVAGTYTANNNTINALIVDQAGNAGGTLTSTLTVTGSLTLGNEGGIYLLSSDNGNKACLNVTGGTLTAGTSGPGTIVFAVNGNNANNQAQVASTIVNNTGGGAVSVVKTGPGSMNFATTTTSSFTGGVYVDQGQLQFGQLEQIGTGPAYVGVNGSLFYIGTGTITNNIFLSPGQGANVYGSAAVANGAGLILSGSSATIGVTGGTLNLMGSPVASFPAGTVQATTGDTISGDNSSGALSCFINCQVTGTGTLELTGAHSGTFKFQNASLVNTNNWQGGMIIGGHTGSAVNVLVQMGDPNQIPSGPGTGDISFNPAENGTANANARIDLNGFNTTVNALIGTAPNCPSQAYVTNSSSTPCTLTFGANNDSATFDGAFGDGGSAKALNLVKVGTGTQTLAGNMATDHGNVTVNAGTLVFSGGAVSNGPANASVITVANGGTLDAVNLSGGGLAVAANQTLNCAGQINGTTTINGTVEALDAIGTFTNNGTVFWSGGSTYIWDINNSTGTAGGDPGWSLIDVINGDSLNITATPGNQINLDITSLTAGDLPGSAANFIPTQSGSWTIATASGGITGFTGSSQFNIVTSGFANAPASSAQWSVNVVGNSLVLSYTAFNLITTPLANVTTNAGSTATFTVASTSGVQPVSYTWSQNNNPLVNGATSGSGSTVTITTNGPGTSSTLSIPNAQDADAGGISVNVSDSASHALGSTATLTIIDAPGSASVAQTGAIMDPGQTAFNSGGRTYLTATVASGGINGVTPDFTYQWYLGNNAILGATNATLAVNISAANAGAYHVIISNSAGNTSTAFALSPVTSVPNQMIFEPFDSYVSTLGFNQGSAPDTYSITTGHTNLFNQITGEPAFWTVAGSLGNSEVAPNGLDNGAENQFGGEYPSHGLAGNSTNEFYWTTTTANNHLRITTNGASLFAPGGPDTNIFFSFTMSVVSLGSGSFDGTQTVFGGFTSSAGPSACGLEFWTWDVSGGASQVQVGIGKGNGTTTSNVTSGVNINPANVLWSGPNSGPLGNGVWTQQSIFVVGCYTVVDGPGHSNDTVSLWIDPPASSYYAQTPPAPYLGPTSFGGTVANSVPQDFALLPGYPPASHRITDLRIGTTWASVTPTAAPTFTLGNVYAPVGTTAVLASQDAGNPVLNYDWQFNGGPQLTDGPTGRGSTISGSGTGTLVISNIQSGDFGLYTINGSNVSFTPSDNGATLTGSATAIVSGQPPKLSVIHTGPDVVVSWPTNWLGFVLEQTPTVSPTSWTTNSLPPYGVSGTNNAVTIPLSGSQEYYRLINP